MFKIITTNAEYERRANGVIVPANCPAAKKIQHQETQQTTHFESDKEMVIKNGKFIPECFVNALELRCSVCKNQKLCHQQ